MPSSELETIAASIQDALHRAYAMGRNDALRRVVEMVQEDELGSKTVALLGHSEPPAEPPHADQPVEHSPAEDQPIHLPHAQTETDAAPGDAPRRDDASRAEPPRGERIQAQTGSMGSFLLDFFYPIGPKK